ncbi:MAG TPA: hypothetical protein VMF91_19945 [Bryobacteraceae bacterium]|nr:hypothetical protein [Bryobacteraceae bacterium]
MASIASNPTNVITWCGFDPDVLLRVAGPYRLQPIECILIGADAAGGLACLEDTHVNLEAATSNASSGDFA